MKLKANVVIAGAVMVCVAGGGAHAGEWFPTNVGTYGTATAVASADSIVHDSGTIVDHAHALRTFAFKEGYPDEPPHTFWLRHIYNFSFSTPTFAQTGAGSGQADGTADGRTMVKTIATNGTITATYTPANQVAGFNMVEGVNTLPTGPTYYADWAYRTTSRAQTSIGGGGGTADVESSAVKKSNDLRAPAL